ncbi:hypothetical protein [Thermococcus sp.]
MVEVGDRVYWVEFCILRSGTIVKKSRLRKKVWIKADGTGFVFQVPAHLIGDLYYTNRTDAIKDAINRLEHDLKMAEAECKRISDIKEEISYLKSMLEGDTNGGGG